MATVTLEGISKYFGPVAAVQELSCTIAQGEFLALLGPSGCGKTTTLLKIPRFSKVLVTSCFQLRSSCSNPSDGKYSYPSRAVPIPSKSWYRPPAISLPKRPYGSTSARGRTTFLIPIRASSWCSVERACARLPPYFVVPCKRSSCATASVVHVSAAWIILI